MSRTRFADEFNRDAVAQVTLKLYPDTGEKKQHWKHYPNDLFMYHFNASAQGWWRFSAVFAIYF